MIVYRARIKICEDRGMIQKDKILKAQDESHRQYPAHDEILASEASHLFFFTFSQNLMRVSIDRCLREVIAWGALERSWSFAQIDSP